MNEYGSKQNDNSKTKEIKIAGRITLALIICVLGGGVGLPHTLLGADRTAYTIKAPTPDSLLRDLSTDRPDKTESPYTVDAGRMQLEVDLLSYSHDRPSEGADQTRVTSIGLGIMNLKLGLRHNLDIQLILQTYQRQSVKTPSLGVNEQLSGFGDIVIRVKRNLWGNDGGRVAFGVMPFISLPTSGSERGSGNVEGGVIFPLAVGLSDKWGMGLMAETDLVRNGADDGYDLTLITSATISHSLSDALGAYAELFNKSNADVATPRVTTGDLGLTYGVSGNLQLDGGVNIGLTKSAENINPFLGFSSRF
ncbi:MAG: transporter [candidate division Zixibacteria bacterium]|nr:transporter [candidate division Zixibacteria bacterium]